MIWTKPSLKHHPRLNSSNQQPWSEQLEDDNIILILHHTAAAQPPAAVQQHHKSSSSRCRLHTSTERNYSLSDITDDVDT